MFYQSELRFQRYINEPTLKCNAYAQMSKLCYFGHFATLDLKY